MLIPLLGSSRVGIFQIFSIYTTVLSRVAQHHLPSLIYRSNHEPNGSQRLAQSTLVSPIKIGSTSHSISMYADDTLVYLSELQQSLPNVLKIVEHFVTLSGYKINYSQSILMLLNTDLRRFNITSCIRVAQKAVYLGIEISPCIQTIARNNNLSIIEER